MMMRGESVLLHLKMTLLESGIRQTQMAVDLGWDPAKLSRIVNQLHTPSPDERKRIAQYLGRNEEALFNGLALGGRRQQTKTK